MAVVWVNLEKVRLLSQLYPLLLREQKLHRVTKIPPRFDDFYDVDLLLHQVERLFNASLSFSLPAASTFLRDQIHYIMTDIAESL